VGRVLRLAVLVLLVGGAAWAVLRWPHLEAVETGATPEYPDLQPREYAASEAEVTRAVEATIERLGWTMVGAGRGRGGSEAQASTRGHVLPTEHEVAVHVRRAGARTRVSVRARSRTFRWDFGENARLIERFLAALDGEVGRRP
jgi:hypothetical protein